MLSKKALQKYSLISAKKNLLGYFFIRKVAPSTKTCLTMVPRLGETCLGETAYCTLPTLLFYSPPLAQKSRRCCIPELCSGAIASVVSVLANNIQRDHLQLGILLAVVAGEDASNGKQRLFSGNCHVAAQRRQPHNPGQSKIWPRGFQVAWVV